jgi:hypothetical protein
MVSWEDGSDSGCHDSEVRIIVQRPRKASFETVHGARTSNRRHAQACGYSAGFRLQILILPAAGAGGTSNRRHLDGLKSRNFDYVVGGGIRVPLVRAPVIAPSRPDRPRWSGAEQRVGGNTKYNAGILPRVPFMTWIAPKKNGPLSAAHLMCQLP